MRQNPYYVLKKLADIPYLLPYGQMIADHRRGLMLNDSGAYFWNLLAEERSLEEVLAAGSTHFEISEAELPAFRRDTTEFLNQLIHYGMLRDEHAATSNADEIYLSIAGLVLKLVGAGNIFPEGLKAFTVATAPEVNQNIEFYTDIPFTHVGSKLLLRNSELSVLERADEYILTFPASKQLLEMQLSKDGSRVRIYYLPPCTAELTESLFHAIRLPFLYLAQRRGMVALHSASILYRERAWLFSGPSGTGKSTHTNLWNQLLNTPVLNGDLNLLAFESGQPVIHGIPWCGTSCICDKNTYPLGGIVLLKQAPDDTITELSPDRKQLLVNLRLISPSWTEALFDANLQAVAQITANILVCQLNCTKENTAVEVMKKRIDNHL